MVRAEDILNDDQTFLQTSDGILARKGSVAATMLNASALDDLLPQHPSPARQERLEQILTDIRSLIPALQVINLFDFFSPFEWLQALPKFREGRSLIAILYLQQYPQCINQDILKCLQQLKGKVSAETQQEINKLLSLKNF